MSDIFHEVDQDIRQEKYRRLWDRFGIWIICVAVLIVVGTGGYRSWVYWQETESQKAGDTFFEAVRLSETGETAEAERLFSELADSIGGYPVLVRMRAAQDLSRSDRTGEAIAQFEAIAQDSSVDSALRSIAALRAGYLAVDTENYAAIADKVEGLTGDDNPFRAGAREILALSAWKEGNIETARRWIAALSADQATPADVNRRVSLLADVIRASHGEDPVAKEGSAQ